MPREPLNLVDYEEVADEYYDASRHPTCANFAELSTRFLSDRLGSRLSRYSNILEVGCGRSTIAGLLTSTGTSVEKLTLLDSSPRMLSYSAPWRDRGATLVVADARATKLRGGDYDLIVASLGDPYNGQPFWTEVNRLLAVDGLCLFTTPSHEWAKRFRHDTDFAYAEFALSDGRAVRVPSHIVSVPAQKALIESCGLEVEQVSSMRVSELTTPRSPKLLLGNASSDYEAVQTFEVRHK
jgi:SAM-dependent methyltransferase